MGKIFITIYGNGNCYAAPSTVTNLEEFTLYAQPFEGETLDNLLMWNSYEEPIAISVVEEQTITYRTEWKNVYVTAYFSGAVDPPEPEPPSFLTKFPWLLAKAAKRWRIDGKY